MKSKGKHSEKVLSALKVKQLTKPGRHSDGNGLYLVVDPSGAKRWLLRIVIKSKRTDVGLGGLTTVSLAEAREKAMEYRKIARAGGDPLEARRATARIAPTFQEIAERVHADHSAGWKNPKHAQQWINTLTQYAFPIIGQLPIDKVDTPDILRVLSPIWLTKAETARRVRQRIGSVFDYAKAAGLRSGDNPIEGVTRGLPKQSDRNGHHEALPFAEVPAFVRKMRETNSSLIAKLAFEFLILTATRTSETLLAQWGEINLESAVWTIPASRMKAGKIHRVPLSHRTKAIVEEVKLLTQGSDFLFPGRDIAKPMSNMVFLQILRRMKLSATAHGFRSSFRDWVSEATSFSREIAEMALAHTIESKVEAAYRRGDLLEKRADMMKDWARFVSGDD